MIRKIYIGNFKSLRSVELDLGRMNLFIGPNASGKSNFFDALRVLQGIGNGFTISEILDGKPKSSTSEVWAGIRGGSSHAGFAGEDGQRICFVVDGDFDDGTDQTWHYEIAFEPQLSRVLCELLSIGEDLYNSAVIDFDQAIRPVLAVRYYDCKGGRPPHLEFEKGRPVLTQFASHPKVLDSHKEQAASVARQLANSQRVDPQPAKLREYSQAHEASRMGEHGENFAALIKTIGRDEKAKAALLTWLKHLRAEEVEDVGTLKGAVGEPMFMLKEGGKEFPAPVLSDGTLRFTAIAAAFFQPDLPALMTIEEIENGIHASRVRLLVELLRNRAGAGKTQVMATTHSPVVLAWLAEEEYQHSFYCQRDPSSGETHISPLTSVPHFMEVIKKQPIGELFAEGWLESAL